MGRDKGTKAAGATEAGGAPTLQDQNFYIDMAPLEFTREQLVGPKSGITRFARTHMNKHDLAGLELGRRDVISMWWLNAGKVFPRGDPKREEIMDQVNSPLFHEFWARHAHDPEYKDESRAFRKVERVVSREETQRYPGYLMMESDSLQILVPRILSTAIQYITFKEMVRWVLEANLHQKIERSDMVSLWDAIIYIIYHFESSATQEKKVRESDEVNSFTLEEYEQIVNEVREMAEGNGGLAQGHKRVHSTTRDKDNEDGAELDNGTSSSKGLRKRRSPSRSAPSKDSVLPSIESPSSPPQSAGLPRNPPPKVAPPTKKSRAKSPPTTKPKEKSAGPKVENQLEKEHMAIQGARTPGTRIMQTKRGTSGSRRGRGTYVYEKTEL